MVQQLSEPLDKNTPKIIDCGVCLEAACHTDVYTDHRRMELLISIPLGSTLKPFKARPPRMAKTSRLDFSTLRTDADLRIRLTTAIDKKFKDGMDQLLTQFDIPTIDEANKAIDDAIREACIMLLPKKQKNIRLLTGLKKTRRLWRASSRKKGRPGNYIRVG